MCYQLLAFGRGLLYLADLQCLLVTYKYDGNFSAPFLA
jgi:hypothetical protein